MRDTDDLKLLLESVVREWQAAEAKAASMKKYGRLTPESTPEDVERTQKYMDAAKKARAALNVVHNVEREIELRQQPQRRRTQKALKYYYDKPDYLKLLSCIDLDEEDVKHATEVVDNASSDSLFPWYDTELATPSTDIHHPGRLTKVGPKDRGWSVIGVDWSNPDPVKRKAALIDALLETGGTHDMTPVQTRRTVQSGTLTTPGDFAEEFIAKELRPAHKDIRVHPNPTSPAEREQVAALPLKEKKRWALKQGARPADIQQHGPTEGAISRSRMYDEVMAMVKGRPTRTLSDGRLKDA